MCGPLFRGSVPVSERRLGRARFSSAGLSSIRFVGDVSAALIVEPRSVADEWPVVLGLFLVPPVCREHPSRARLWPLQNPCWAFNRDLSLPVQKLQLWPAVTILPQAGNDH